MANDSKVYVINPAKTVNPRTFMEKTVKPAPETPEGNGGRSRHGSKRDWQVHPSSPQSVILSYILGPLAIFATPVGRNSKIWAPLAGVSAALILVLLLGWGAILSRFGEKGYVIVPLMIAASVSLLVGFTVWARAVYLIGRYRPVLARNLPEPLKKPATVGILGFLVPGLGLILSGHHRRAAIAAWLSGLLGLSAFVLSRAAWLWSWNRGAGSDALEGTTLEHLFFGMGIAGIVGTFVWIVQALDGSRLAWHRFGQNGRRHSSGGAAFALLAALTLFALFFQPASVADTLDDLALSAGHEGFRLLPLHAELAAMRLDPSRPLFAVRAADLYDELGREENALIIRSELVTRWRPCVGALRRHGLLGSSAGSGAVVTAEDESPEPAVAVSVESVDEEAPKGLWERIRSEYGLFALPVE